MNKTMKLYLSKRRNGLYQLTALQPIVTNVAGSDVQDVYPTPGDPINFQGLCPFSVKRLFGQELEALQVTRVKLVAEAL